MNPATDRLRTEPHPNETRQHGSDSSLQLAQIYSHPRHQEERGGIDDILSRCHGRGRSSYLDNTYQDSYNENLDTHFGINEHGAHVGFRMSRTQQTPFGDARSDVGMQMSFGNHGLEVRTSSATSLRRGGQGRSSMFCYSLGSRYTSPLSLFFQPIDSTGMTSFGGLFSPFYDMNSPALGSYSCNQDSSSFDSGGPIIEEMVDEDLGLIDEINSRSHPMITERQDEIDPSLGLGLIPDNETADGGNDENIQEEERSESLRLSDGISGLITDNETADDGNDENIQEEERSESLRLSDGISNIVIDPEASKLPNIFTSHSERNDIEETDPAEFSTERQFKESQATVSEFNKNSVEKQFVYVSTDMPEYFKATKSVVDTKSDIRFENRGKSKFTKRNFKDVPFRLKEKDAGLSILISSSEENRTLGESQSNQPSHGGLVSSPSSTNSKEQNKRKTSNKNTLPRHRNNTFCSFSPEQDSKFESFESFTSLNTMSVSPHEIPSSRDGDYMGKKKTESDVNINGPYSDKITLSSQKNRLQSGNKSSSINPTDAGLLKCSSKKTDQNSMSSQEQCENFWEKSEEFHCTPVLKGKRAETSPVENNSDEVNHLSEKVEHSFDNLTRLTDRLTNGNNNFSSDDLKMVSEAATKSDWSARVPEPDIANTEEDFDNSASTKIQTTPLKFIDGVTFDTFPETKMQTESELKENRNEENWATGKTENGAVSIEQRTFSTKCVRNSDAHLFIQEEYCEGKQRKYPRQKSQQHVSSNYESTRNDFFGNINDAVSREKHHYHHKCAKCLLQENCEHRSLHRNFHKCCQKYVYVCNDCGKQITRDVSTNVQLGTNDNDIYDHPEWQYLNEYTTQNDQFGDLPQKPVKTKVNKNATSKSGVSTPASKQVQTQIRKDTRKSSRYDQTNDFAYLIETVGLVMQDVYPDGNCLFASICDQLRIRGDFSYTPKYLRRAAVNFLREHPNQEDGTPLVEFLTDEERNWEKYLVAMSQDGEWGDHFVIWALAHVLNRRIVICSGYSDLQKTVVEPMGPMKGINKTENMEHPDAEGFDNDIDKDRQEVSNPGNEFEEASQNVDEIYLGHMWQSHYVSLRPKDWHNKLCEVLKKKETSSLIGSNPESMKLDCEMFLDQDVPHSHLNFAIKIIMVSEIMFFNQKKGFAARNSMNDRYHIEMHVPDFDVMYGVIPGSKYRAQFTKSKCFMIPTDTHVYNRESRNKASVKDLLFDIDKSETGCTKLKAIDPLRWINSLDSDGYLKHLLFSPSSDTTSKDSETSLAFYCEWPNDYGDWLTRKRKHNWPKQNVVDIIKKSGCRVAPQDKSSPVEWEIIFYQAEKVVSEKAVTDEQIQCFIFTKLILDNNLDNPFRLQQMKHVFFYMCEDTDEDLWKNDLSKCVRLFLGRLKDCLQCRKIPNYFLPDINLLDDSMTDDSVCKAIERIETVQRHPFVALYFICSKYAHIFQSIKDLFEMIIEDSMMYAVDKNLDMSLRDCFLPLVAKSLYNLVEKHRYKEALERSKSATEQLHLLVHNNKSLHLEDVIDEVMFLSRRKLLNKWLFAFCADQELGTLFIETACEGLHRDKKTASVLDYYGRSAVDHFELLTDDMDILIPEELVALPKLAETTFHFLELLESICDEDVCAGVLGHFYSHHLTRLLHHTSTMPSSALPVIYLDKVVNKMKEYEIV